MKKPAPKKPIDAYNAKEMFIEDTKEFVDSLYNYMTGKGYKWDRAMNQWVDDGSLEAEWADRVIDEAKDEAAAYDRWAEQNIDNARAWPKAEND